MLNPLPPRSPFPSQGDLKQYLRDCRPTKPDPRDKLNVDHLQSMVQQISSAMKYLELKKVIHRDLAARNVLVGEENIVKLADFGMVRLRSYTSRLLTTADSVRLLTCWPRFANFSRETSTRLTTTKRHRTTVCPSNGWYVLHIDRDSPHE